MEKRHPLSSELTSWPTRQAMVSRGLTINMPWLAFVHVSFALMILLRNTLVHNFDPAHVSGQQISSLVDAAMLGVIALSAALIVMSWRHITGISLVLFTSGLLWALCCYWFIVDWQLPHAWPLCTILLLTAVTALYFYPVGLLSSVLPLWFTLPIASVVLNHGLNMRFAAVWIVFTLILICGRFILLRWFDEAWQRNQQNQLLIARLDALAHQDPLTETANRREMENVLERAVSQGKSFTLLMLDVDYFKLYNDAYGHQAGDECLVRVAQALKASVRTPEDLVSRYGGEEFLLILFDCPPEMADQVAKRIQDNLRQAAIVHKASKVSEYVTASMGIAGMTAGLTADEMVAQADAALYRAKEGGRNRWSR
ncbi:Phytochrome-like protein cph2 [compost metagenome]|uniref:GGDEF domain-containing protein n=1 Tax=Lelliottia aquatilis TaxID=2080838 RepID=UPI000CDEB493|nr:GGDEF domain-containing protein [Lelliottia aquatilis]POZ18523.1 GGDEF domain-containing protein [Lelliottia aquatilis]